MVKRGTILWDKFLQQLVEVESVNKKKTWFLLAPLWSPPGCGTRATMFGRPPSYISLFCTPIWKDFPISKKRIPKDPMHQFHDSDAFSIEVCINQPFLKTTEYLCDN
jgi:hypothetical protein